MCYTFNWKTSHILLLEMGLFVWCFVHHEFDNNLSCWSILQLHTFGLSHFFEYHIADLGRQEYWKNEAKSQPKLLISKQIPKPRTWYLGCTTCETNCWHYIKILNSRTHCVVSALYVWCWDWNSYKRFCKVNLFSGLNSNQFCIDASNVVYCIEISGLCCCAYLFVRLCTQSIIVYYCEINHLIKSRSNWSSQSAVTNSWYLN